MSCFKGFLCFDGNEFANAARDYHYMNTSGHPALRGPIDMSCVCDGLTPGGTLAASIRITGGFVDGEEGGVTGTVSSEGAPLFISSSAGYLYGSYVMGSGGPCSLPSIPSVDSPSWVDLPPFGEPLPSNYETNIDGGVSPGTTVNCHVYRYVIKDAGSNTVGYIYTIDDHGSPLRYWAASSELGISYGWQDPTEGDLVYEFSAEGPGGSWSNPADDDVWWYDAAVPESTDVVGIWVEDFKISPAMKRDVKDKLWGASIGSPTYGKREVVITGWVLTKSGEATDYMRQAIHELLIGDTCGCEPPDLTYWKSCPSDNDRHIRTIRQCSLTQLDWAVEPSFNYSQGAKFVATLTSEVPWIAKAPTTVYEAPAVVSEPICNICNPCPTYEVVDYTCGCLNQPIRVVPEPDSYGCYHAPITVSRSCIIISPTTIWGQGVVNLEVFSGTAHNADGSGLRNLRVRGWANPDGMAVDADSIVCGEPCIDIELACLPAGATLVIDSLARRAKITKSGQTSRAGQFLSSGGGGIFGWPEFSCAGLYMCIDADGSGTSETASIRIETQEFERA